MISRTAFRLAAHPSPKNGQQRWRGRTGHSWFDRRLGSPAKLTASTYILSEWDETKTETLFVDCKPRGLIIWMKTVGCSTFQLCVCVRSRPLGQPVPNLSAPALILSDGGSVFSFEHRYLSPACSSPLVHSRPQRRQHDCPQR